MDTATDTPPPGGAPRPLTETPPNPAPTPQAAAEQELRALTPELAQLRWSSPFRWLRLGWQDFRREPGIGLFFGACFVLMGWLLLVVFRHAPAYTLALSAGFLLMGPFLCLGLYEVSRQLQFGRSPRIEDALGAWTSHRGQLAIFGGALLVLELIWGRASLVVFAVSFEGVPDFSGSPLALFSEENLGFLVAYSLVGSVFASLIFASCVISIPMMLDREVDAITAALTSIKLTLTQTGVMLLWGGIVALLVALAMLPFFLGLLLIGPLLGHASWHAYQEAVGSAE
ncbi:DUF2189 domain-containing protein [Roseateles sp. BYS180W]|uniref:DUF2189 domain-containing protein n=1 Tax=Roseateles rivi TaxID=3299028 RepID=A0ABW7FZP3_9BURK